MFSVTEIFVLCLQAILKNVEGDEVTVAYENGLVFHLTFSETVELVGRDFGKPSKTFKLLSKNWVLA
jgi:hypothetical protein